MVTQEVIGSAMFGAKHRSAESVYQEAYGFTMLRVLVDAFELWLGIVVLLVIVAGIRWSGWWLPRAALVSGAAMLLVIGFANPEAWVAERNIERFYETGKIDTYYLSGLSADAVPTIVGGLPEDLARCATWNGGHEWAEHDLLSWNLGRARAAEVEGTAIGQEQPVGCP